MKRILSIKAEGQRSSVFCVFTNTLSITTPEQDIELLEVAGKDGDIAFDGQRLKGVDKSFPCVVCAKMQEC